jgi:hypothetical protein
LTELWAVIVADRQRKGLLFTAFERPGSLGSVGVNSNGLVIYK